MKLRTQQRVYADHLGKFEAELKDEEFNKAQLWKVIKEISAIELHIRSNEEDLGDTAEGIFAKAEAQTAYQTEEAGAGMKRKIGDLLKVNGHKHRLGKMHGMCNNSGRNV